MRVLLIFDTLYPQLLTAKFSLTSEVQRCVHLDSLLIFQHHCFYFLPDPAVSSQISI